MYLSGYRKTTGNIKGGITKLALAKTDWIESFIYDYGTSSYSEIILKKGYNFHLYEFKEDTARYDEEIIYDNGICSVIHSVRFSTGHMGSYSKNAINELLRANNTGVAAILENPSGECILVGISLKYNTEKPLKLISVNSTTGEKPLDDQQEIIILQSHDVSKAEPFTGELHIA